MTRADPAISVFVTLFIVGALNYAPNQRELLAAVASKALQDSCVLGSGHDIVRSTTYRENGQTFLDTICGTTAVLRVADGPTGKVTRVQAIEPVPWLPDRINVYSPEENLMKFLGKPDRYDPGRNISRYSYDISSKLSVEFQIPATSRVIGSVTVIYR